MQLWLAVDLDLKGLGVEKANTSEQAYYQFMTRSVYPDQLIQLPEYLHCDWDCPKVDFSAA